MCHCVTVLISSSAVYHFWMHVGERMNLQQLPQSLEEAVALVDDYVESDRSSKATTGGKKLVEAITNLLVRYVV